MQRQLLLVGFVGGSLAFNGGKKIIYFKMSQEHFKEKKSRKASFYSCDLLDCVDGLQIWVAHHLDLNKL